MMERSCGILPVCVNKYSTFSIQNPRMGVLTNEDYAAARGTLRERTSYDPAVPPYHVGDTVYLDDRPHQITELRDNTVQAAAHRHELSHIPG